MGVRVAGVLLTVLALMIGLVTPASAKSITLYDDINDVAVDPSAPVEPLDLYYVDVTYTAKRLTVTASFFNRLGVSFGDRWTTAKLRLETTGDKKTDYTLMARHLDNRSMSEPPAEPIATYFYGPKDKLIAQSRDVSKSQAGKFVFRVEDAGPHTLTFTVPAKAIGKPDKLKFSLWVDLTDGSYGRTFGLDTYPGVKSGSSLGWTKAIANGKAKAAKPKKTTTTITVDDTSITRAARTSVTITVKQGVAGKAVIYDGSATVDTVTVRKGESATYRLPNMRPGTHEISVKFVPKSAKYKASTSQPVALRVR